MDVASGEGNVREEARVWRERALKAEKHIAKLEEAKTKLLAQNTQLRAALRKKEVK